MANNAETRSHDHLDEQFSMVGCILGSCMKMRLNSLPSALRKVRAVGAVATLLTAAPFTSAMAAGPFGGFAGEWTGGGDISMTDGSQEKIRCKASYSVGPSGAALNINVNCASDSYRVNIISNIVAQGSNFEGTWRETTRQADGKVTGHVPSPGELQANLDGTGFGIQLAATTNGKQQSVTIQAEGTDVKSVKISLHKS